MRTLDDIYNSTDDTETGLLGRAHPRAIGRGVASLIGKEETTQEPDAYARSSSEIHSASVDVDRPDGETELYWQEYQKNPIIATQLQNTASEVFEAGWWLTADSDKTLEEMTEFCNHMGIKGGHTHRSFSQLGQMAVIQYLGRGTFMGEKMTDDSGRHTGINPVNPTSFEFYTKPGVSVLVPPDHTPDDDHTVKQTEDGEVAAYVQFDRRMSRYQDREERRFTREEMIHWARRPDIGDVRGNSAIEPVFERSRALREKLQDNDMAIAMKAWPMVMFQTGTPEHPWNETQQEDFMADYSEEELGPGMFQAVPGDVDVHEFAGETADIEEHVMTDIDYIVSGMPGPKYALGSFIADHESVRAGAHERTYRKMVRSLRRDLENIFTPYLRSVAESWDLDPSGLEINIGRPGNEVAPEDIQGNIIRYQSDVNDDSEDGDDGDGQQPSGPQPMEPDLDSRHVPRDGDGDGRINESSRPSPAGNSNWVGETLADPRLVSTQSIEDDLASTITTVLSDTRDSALDSLTEPIDPDDAVQGFDNAFHVHKYDGTMSSAVQSTVLETFEATVETLGQETHAPQIDAVSRRHHRQILRDTADAIHDDTMQLLSQIQTDAGRQFSRDDGPEAARERIREQWDDGKIAQRASLIARMRVHEIVNKVKLDHYRQHDEVSGIRVIAHCRSETTDLIADLAGCDDGEPAVARFDAEQSLGAQFQAQTSVDPPQGFNPLPSVPPFHFGDRAEIAPVTAN